MTIKISLIVSVNSNSNERFLFVSYFRLIRNRKQCIKEVYKTEGH